MCARRSADQRNDQENYKLQRQENDHPSQMSIKYFLEARTNVLPKKCQIPLTGKISLARTWEVFHRCVVHSASRQVAQSVRKVESTSFADAHGNSFGGVRPPNVCVGADVSARCDLRECYKLRRENPRPRSHQSPRRCRLVSPRCFFDCNRRSTAPRDGLVLRRGRAGGAPASSMR